MEMPSSFVFFRATSDVPSPKRADPLVLGSISQRAALYCEPLLAASGYGWNLYPPLDFELLWDGNLTYWRELQSENWMALNPSVLLPGSDAFTESAPPQHREYTKFPFLARAPEPGIVQIWSGLIVRSPHGWASHIAPVANYPRQGSFDVVEGVIETDWWCGPMITPVRILKTDVAVTFRRSSPYCQLKPLLKECYSSDFQESFQAPIVAEEFDEQEWILLSESIAPRNNDCARRGSYRKEATRRRKS